MSSDIFLEEKFILVGQTDIPVTVELSPVSIHIRADSSRRCVQSVKVWDILIEDIVGARVSNLRKIKHEFDEDIEKLTLFEEEPSGSLQTGNSSSASDEYLHIFWYPKSISTEDNREVFTSVKKTITLRPKNDRGSSPQGATATNLRFWRKSLLYCMRALTPVTHEAIFGYEFPTVKPILFLVNPKSGTGNSVKIFREKVEPILWESERSYQVILTKHQNHGREFFCSTNIHQWSGIIVVSGDGLFHELVNGLFERQDWTWAIKIPVGIIPGGSGNGLARSVAFQNDEALASDAVVQAALTVVRGQQKPLDLMCIETPKGFIYSHLSVGYGIISDLDIESERLRFLGESRFSLWSLIRIVNLRTYKAKLWYLPAEGYHTSYSFKQEIKSGSVLKKSRKIRDDPPIYRSARQEKLIGRDRYFSVAETNYDSVITGSVYETLPEEDSMLSGSSSKDSARSSEVDATSFQSVQEDDSGGDSQQAKVHVPDLGVPRLNEQLPAKWIQIEDEFVHFYAVIQSHISSSIHYSPMSSLSDEVIWLSFIRRGAFHNKKVSKVMIAKFFTMMQDGTHLSLPGVEVVPVKSFRLQPSSSRGNLVVDGEKIETSTIQATVVPSVITIRA